MTVTNKPKANLLALIILIILVSLLFGPYLINATLNPPKQPKPNIVQTTIIIESNIDWSGSISCTGQNYGFYSISGSVYDSADDNQTYTYKANFIDLNINGQFQSNFFGTMVTISDGYLHVLVYIDGKLEYNKLITTLSAFSGCEFKYNAGYS